MQEPVLGHLLVLGTGTAIVGIRVYTYASAGREETDYLNVLRIHETYEVLHDGVDAVLVEVAVVAEAEEVELETLRLNHAVVGEIADANLCEVGLPCDGTEACELGTVEAHPVVVVGVAVLEALEEVGVVVESVVGLAAELLKVILLAVHIML